LWGSDPGDSFRAVAEGGLVVVSSLRTWQRDASCRGPESVLFFPPSHAERKEDRDGRERRAKAICAECPVKTHCLDEALRIGEPHGIWGGLTESERRELAERA